MNTLLGMKATFSPTCIEDVDGGYRKYGELTVTGVVDYVNNSHGWFAVAYYTGDMKQHECFRFDEIGKAVTLLG